MKGAQDLVDIVTNQADLLSDSKVSSLLVYCIVFFCANTKGVLLLYKCKCIVVLVAITCYSDQ